MKKRKPCMIAAIIILLFTIIVGIFFAGLSRDILGHEFSWRKNRKRCVVRRNGSAR